MGLDWDALASIDDLRNYIVRERTDSTEGLYSDASLATLINDMSAAIKGYCDRQLISAVTALTYTLDGDGDRTLYLPEYPIVSITSIYDASAGLYIPARTSYNGTGYCYSDADALGGRVQLEGYTLTPGYANIIVVANLGYSATVAATFSSLSPYHSRALNALSSACIQWASYIFNAPVPSSETVLAQGISMTVREQPIPTRVKAMIEPYRRVPLL